MALVGGEWTASHSDRFPPEGSVSDICLMDKRITGPQRHSDERGGREENSYPYYVLNTGYPVCSQ